MVSRKRKVVWLTSLLNVCERLKFRQGNFLSGIKYVKAIPYIWYLFIGRLENSLIKKVQVKDLTLNNEPREETIILSLTSFPARIEKVITTIKSLYLQTIKPDRIILWLAKEQFPDGLLPKQLTALQQCGLEVRYCEDYRSHKKYLKALQEQREKEVVITFDDDIIYDTHTIERTMNTHTIYPNAVIVNQAMIPQYDEKGNLKPYSKWKEVSIRNHPQGQLSPLTGSGCLYPYNALKSSAFDWDVIKDNAISADDLWIFFQCTLNGTPVVITNSFSKVFTVVNGSQNENLSQINCLGDGNDRTINNLLALYPEFKDKLIEINKQYTIVQ